MEDDQRAPLKTGTSGTPEERKNWCWNRGRDVRDLIPGLRRKRTGHTVLESFWSVNADSSKTTGIWGVQGRTCLGETTGGRDRKICLDGVGLSLNSYVPLRLLFVLGDSEGSGKFRTSWSRIVEYPRSHLRSEETLVPTRIKVSVPPP